MADNKQVKPQGNAPAGVGAAVDAKGAAESAPATVVNVDGNMVVSLDNFNLEGATFTIQNGNLLITLGSGENLVLAGFSNMLGNPEPLVLMFSSGASVTADRLVQLMHSQYDRNADIQDDTINVTGDSESTSEGVSFSSLNNFSVPLAAILPSITEPTTSEIASSTTTATSTDTTQPEGPNPEDPNPEEPPEPEVTIEGTKGDDILVGSDANDLINAYAGNDIIDARAGADIINASAGNDTITWDGLDTLIQGGTNYDTLTTSSDNLNIDLSNTAIEDIEAINLTTVDSTLHVTSADIDRVSEFDGLFVQGTDGAEITASEFTNRGDNVEYDGVTYATYSTLNADSPILFAEIGLSLNGAVISPNAPIYEGTATMTFVDESTRNSNTIGYYTVNEDGTISDVNILIPNASNGGKDSINNGDTFDMGSYLQGENYQFFIISDGYDANSTYSGIDFSTGSLTFVNSTGDPASITDTGPLTLIYTDTLGNETTLLGDIFHTENTNLNVDGLDHATVTVNAEDNTATIIFEDSIDYDDFDDVTLNIHLQDASATVAGEVLNGDTTTSDFGIIDINAIGGVTVVDDTVDPAQIDVIVADTTTEYTEEDLINADPNVIL